ncbi:hypothetical protein KC19_2G192400 [Ceratodon purpureus]|uniref:Uncharacterized protein n=1 Tax=Ceratodon purpureus TaxID=3225 RepID=A0A8T0IY39_CERPU|nr:hypothetical protein KC19_2G192400 [Ceratodon purpureus]
MYERFASLCSVLSSLSDRDVSFTSLKRPVFVWRSHATELCLSYSLCLFNWNLELTQIEVTGRCGKLDVSYVTSVSTICCTVFGVCLHFPFLEHLRLSANNSPFP